MSGTANKDKIKKKKHLFVVITVILCVVLTGEIILYAWFTNQKSIKTITEINTPYKLMLGAGNKEDITRLSLGNIDVKSDRFVDEESGEGKSFYVFSVSSDFDASNPYVIQLSHTTNIAFDYNIYHAVSLGEDKSNITGTDRENGLVEYITQNNRTIYYCIDKKNNIPMHEELYPQNLSLDEKRIASEYEKTYGDYENIQKHAKPVYYKTSPIVPSGGDKSGFVDYYILEISWETKIKDGVTASDIVSNDKETDLIYLMALRL